MNQKERDWLDWLKRAKDKKITQRFAAEKMGVTERWVRELLSTMKTKGDAVVVHGLRGGESNRRIEEEIQARAVAVLKTPDWHDFGPTFAKEQLGKLHDIKVSKETVRQWMIEEKLWKSKSRKLGTIHEWRERRSHRGELVQWDTSTHDWLERRGEPVKCLVRMIDDATSQSWGRFVWSDGTRENMGVLWEYLARYGRPVDCYTDGHAMFKVPDRAGESKPKEGEPERLTQIGRALRELGIGWIHARSPEAKGRVERGFETDQDRLIKLMRLAKVKTMKEANEFLEKEYWPEWNERFTVRPKAAEDVHRPVSQEIDLAATLSHVESRVIAKDFTFAFGGKHYQIVRQDLKAGMKGQRLRIEVRLDGGLKARLEGRYLEVHECGSRPPASPKPPSKPVRKDHNAGGRSKWMDGFWNQPTPPLWQLLSSK